MNISASRDYNVSFAVDESLQFPPNVTEYKIPLQYGTNYTIALRGLTTSGAKEVTTENIEIDIGGEYTGRHGNCKLFGRTINIHRFEAVGCLILCHNGRFTTDTNLLQKLDDRL